VGIYAKGAWPVHKTVGAGHGARRVEQLGLVPPAPRAPRSAFVAAQALPLTNGAGGHGGLGDADDDDALSIDSQGTL